MELFVKVSTSSPLSQLPVRYQALALAADEDGFYDTAEGKKPPLKLAWEAAKAKALAHIQELLQGSALYRKLETVC